ncbi:zinc finger BED domain-containing protein 4-like [Solea senegalensis]|uniref:Zinc finger BED domain-containing protein 4-like n=1 Tax=Solea senegalensis TaxID=28829 RepID=A0AAV6T3X1_SOLSE|nr:zinc finger BED domain-containing protein 4-like [Solea senegalensis]
MLDSGHLCPKWIPIMFSLQGRLWRPSTSQQRRRLRLQFEKVAAVSLTSDMWTSINMDAYLAVTCHFVGEAYTSATSSGDGKNEAHARSGDQMEQHILDAATFGGAKGASRSSSNKSHRSYKATDLRVCYHYKGTIKQRGNEEMPQASTSHDVTGGSKLWRRLDTSVMEARRSQNVTADATVEVQRYLSEPNIGRLENSLEYCERQKLLYPNLYKLALAFLCTTASTVPCERVFSKAGEVVSKKRNLC